MYLAVTIGAIKKAVRYGNFYGGKIAGVMQVDGEWKKKGYQLSWLIKAIYTTSLEKKKEFKHLLKAFFERKE